MNPWLLAAFAMLPGFVASGYLMCRATVRDAIVALNLAGVLATLEFLLLAEGFHQSAFFELAVVLSVLSFASSLVFVRYLGRWI